MTPQRNTGAGAEAERPGLPEYTGHYVLESCLGSGGMGVVHLARSTSGMRVAVKVVHAEFAKDPEFRGRFRQEVAAARRVSGAFTAPVVDADPGAERPWMATLFIPGPTLSDRVKRNGPLAPGELRRLMAGLAEALRDIHRVGVVHRDLKPSNVLLAEDGPKVIDFGISRPKDSELRTETGKLIGTPPFMAPEQFRRPREVGPAADVFALGSVMVHAATGRGPFDSDSPYVVAYQVVHHEPDMTGVPENLAPLVLRCLAKEPEDRPTPDELMRELRSVAASYDTQAFIPAQRPEDGPLSVDGPMSGTDRGGAPGGASDLGAPAAATGDPADAGDPPDTDDSADAGGSAHAKNPTDVSEPAGPSVGRPRRRVSRRMALVAATLGLVVGGVFASVELAGGAASSPNPGPRATAGRFAAWESESVSGAASVPRCSYGSGTLFCAQSGLVFALDASDGAVLWKHRVRKAYGSAPPVLAGGLVQPMADQERRLEGLDPRTGTPRWTRDMPAHVGLRVVGGTVLLTGPDGTVTAVGAASGTTTWRHALPGRGTPAFSSFAGDPLAYATSASDAGSTKVTAVDPGTGTVRWDARLHGTLRPVGSSGGHLFFLSVDKGSGFTDAVVRYDPVSGATRRVPLPVERADPVVGVHGDVVYLLATGGSLEAVDTDARKRLWHLETGVTRGSAPVAAGDHLYLTAPDGRLLAVDARDGGLLGQTPPRLGANSDQVSGYLPVPVVADGHVYAAAPDGTVFAVDGRDPAGW
ncbi:PQQ-binding-like beta-propeller repeat protein [Streptomyces longwoodensis]|uniref:protein kinase domain-containing protein n=1 Tax=Streptomyces longwoodensis TaxID=68231 RepID=UPI0037F7B611